MTRTYKSKHGWTEIPVGGVKFFPGHGTCAGTHGDCTVAYRACKTFMANHPEYKFRCRNAIVDGVRGLNVERLA